MFTLKKTCETKSLFLYLCLPGLFLNFLLKISLTALQNPQHHQLLHQHPGLLQHSLQLVCLFAPKELLVTLLTHPIARSSINASMAQRLVNHVQLDSCGMTQSRFAIGQQMLFVIQVNRFLNVLYDIQWQGSGSGVRVNTDHITSVHNLLPFQVRVAGAQCIV